MKAFITVFLLLSSAAHADEKNHHKKDLSQYQRINMSQYIDLSRSPSSTKPSRFFIRVSCVDTYGRHVPTDDPRYEECVDRNHYGHR